MRLTGRVCAGGSAVSQENVDEFQPNSCGLQTNFDQHRLDVGRVHAAVRGHEQGGAGLQQVCCGGGSAGHHGFQVTDMGQAVVEETKPADAADREGDRLNTRASLTNTLLLSETFTWFWRLGPLKGGRGYSPLQRRCFRTPSDPGALSGTDPGCWHPEAGEAADTQQMRPQLSPAGS